MKKFHLTDTYAIINFDAANIHSQSEIISSKSFYTILRKYISSLRKEKSILLIPLKSVKPLDIINFYKLLLVYDLKSSIGQVKNIKESMVPAIYEFSENFYDYWRNLKRYGFLKSSRSIDQNLKVHDLIKASNEFNERVITLYRTITQKLLQDHFHVYRQLPAGINANLLYVNYNFTSLKEYKCLDNIPIVTKIVTNPPFILNSKSNTRSGYFSELKYNPISKLEIDPLHFIAFPLKIGPLLAYVYIHRDYLHHGIALSNLFQFASFEEIKERKPNLLFVFGIQEADYDCQYYIDKKNAFYLGFVTHLDKNDYFGYLKKMLLTLHNLYMIDQGYLPIHGAMMQITCENKVKNIVLIGDSGAGKSETLEALRSLGNRKIKDMKVIFDDMGTFKFTNGKIVANGTETGAFIRLDDLDQGYAYDIMDRALFINPHQINSRVVIPISTYEFICQDHPIDLLLYANNYENEKGIKLFTSLDEAIEVFEKGVRKAKGTTSEEGITSSFFANPFGPYQEKDKVHKSILKYFEKLTQDGVKIGQIYTKLAIDEYEHKGPKEAAKSLLDLLLK